MSKKIEFKNSISAATLLGVLFVGLKLTGYITWSWWLVTIPFWGGLAIGIAILLIVLLLALIGSLIK
jgi:uncharacterized protein (DUF983 family)